MVEILQMGWKNLGPPGSTSDDLPGALDTYLAVNGYDHPSA
jgi:hypothetical protein